VIVSSPTTRCVSTLLPFADIGERDVATRRELVIGRANAAAELVRQLQRSEGDAVVCTHGEVIGPLLETLFGEAPVRPTAKGAVWILGATGPAIYVPEPNAPTEVFGSIHHVLGPAVRWPPSSKSMRAEPVV